MSVNVNSITDYGSTLSNQTARAYTQDSLTRAFENLRTSIDKEPDYSEASIKIRRIKNGFLLNESLYTSVITKGNDWFYCKDSKALAEKIESMIDARYKIIPSGESL